MVRGSITPELWARDFDNLQTTEGLEEAIEACKALACGKIKWLLLLGPVGCGKTHLAVATAKLLDSLHVVQVADTLVYDAKIQWWSVPDLLARQRATWGTDDTPPLTWCKECDLLVLDDLGLEPPPGTSAQRSLVAELMGVLDARYRAKAPVLITTNFDLDALNARYGERLISRCMELGEVVEIKAPDYRVTGTPQELEPVQPQDALPLIPTDEDPVTLAQYLKSQGDRELSGMAMQYLLVIAREHGWQEAVSEIERALERKKKKPDQRALERHKNRKEAILGYIRRAKEVVGNRQE